MLPTMSSRLCGSVAPLGLILLTALAGPTQAADWYAAPQGQPTGKGTKDSPWDLASALVGKHTVKPGDTLLLLGGIYRRRPQETFRGQADRIGWKPDSCPARTGEHPHIDGGLSVLEPSAHLWIWDLELFVSEPNPDKPVSAGSWPGDLKRPWGGLHMYGGRHCKYIHLVIHHCRQGVSFWTGARDSELYGCIIFDNGWLGVDRGHGHAIYTQNNEGLKTIADCIMTGGYGFTMHAYGSSRADVNNYLVEGNICYRGGTFLIGGGKPSQHIRVFQNVLYGISMQLGYSAPYNEDCEVRDNLIVNGGLTINKFRKVVKEGNTILAKEAKRPLGVQVFLRPSRYDSGRAHLAVFNPDRESTVLVDPGSFLKVGDRYRVLSPRGLQGPPLVRGTFAGKPIQVPMTKEEFAAFVLRRGA